MPSMSSEAAGHLSDQEEYIALLLSDSNLPTGGFVASAGLESAFTHCLIDCLPIRGYIPGPDGKSLLRNPSRGAAHHLVDFVEKSLGSYHRLVAPIIAQTHALLDDVGNWAGTEDAVERFKRLDQLMHAQTLNHVNRRASIAQGAALLTLYSKAFAGTSPEEVRQAFDRSRDESISFEDIRRGRVASLMAVVKREVRAQRTTGHLPTVWGLFTAALGLGVERAIRLHLFLQARALLSSAVRLNILGPYLAHQLLLFNVRGVLADIEAEHRSSFVGLFDKEFSEPHHKETKGQVSEWDWDWDDEDSEYVTSTWPLLELVQSRHDQLHSRLFNS